MYKTIWRNGRLWIQSTPDGDFRPATDGQLIAYLLAKIETMEAKTVKIRVVLRGRVDTIKRTFLGDFGDREALQTIIDQVEGQIGTVLSVIGPGGERLYTSAIQPHEAGVV